MKKKVPYWSQLGTCHSPYAGIVEESLYRKHCTSVGSVFPVGKKKQHIKKKKKDDQWEIVEVVRYKSLITSIAKTETESHNQSFLGTTYMSQEKTLKERIILKLLTSFQVRKKKKEWNLDITTIFCLDTIKNMDCIADKVQSTNLKAAKFTEKDCSILVNL